MEIVVGVLAIFGVIFLILLIWIGKIYSNVKQNKSDRSNIMDFRDNQAAFEMACTLNTNIVKDKPIVAVSMQDMKKVGEPIMVKIAGEPPFYAHASTSYLGEHLIKNGDLLGVIPFKKAQHLTTYMQNDDRKEWLFLIISEINPRYHVVKQMWSIKHNFIEKAAINERLEK